MQTRDKDHGGRALQLYVGRRAAHELRQLVAHDLGHHLPGLHGRQHVLTHRLLLYLVGESLGDLVVYVGIDQRAAYLFQRLGDIDFGDAAFAFQYFERSFKFVG